MNTADCTLPAAIAARIAQRPQRESKSARGTPFVPVPRTLLADHSPDSEFLLTDREQFDVVARTRSGGEVLALARRWQPNLVVMAFTIPDVNVLEVIRRLKALSHRPRIVIVSNYDDPHHRSAVLQAGADKFVVKAEISPRLLEGIARLCARPVTPLPTAHPRRGMPNWLCVSAAVALMLMAAAAVVGAGFTSWHYWQEESRAGQRAFDQQRQLAVKYWESHAGKSQPSESASMP